MASIAAAFLLVFGVGLGTYSYCAPYAYVNMDINPSVKITTNIYDRIIDIEGLNEDGEELISSGDVKNRKLQDGIERILENAFEAGYLKDESDNAVMFTVSSKNQKRVEQIQKKVNMAATDELKAKNVESEIIVEKANVKRHQEAEALGISPGKLLLIDKVREIEPELKVEDLKNAQVKDIVKLIKENRKAEKDEKDEKAGKPEKPEKPEKAQKTEKLEKPEDKTGKKPGEDKLTEKPKAQGKVKDKGEFFKREKNEEKKNQDNKDNKGSKGSKDKAGKETGKPNKNNSKDKSNSNNPGKGSNKGNGVW